LKRHGDLLNFGKVFLKDALNKKPGSFGSGPVEVYFPDVAFREYSPWKELSNDAVKVLNFHLDSKMPRI